MKHLREPYLIILDEMFPLSRPITMKTACGKNVHASKVVYNQPTCPECIRAVNKEIESTVNASAAAQERGLTPFADCCARPVEKLKSLIA